MVSQTTSVPKLCLQYMAKHKAGFFLIFFVVTIAEVADIGVNYVIKVIIDNIAVFENTFDNYIFLLKLVLLIFGLNIVTNLMYRTSGFTAMKLIPKIRSQFRTDIFEHLHKHSQKFFTNNFAGSLANKINQAGRGLTDIYGSIFWEIYNGIIFLLFSTILLWFISPWIVFVEIILLTSYMTLASKLIFKGLPLQKKYADARSFTTGKLVDSIGNIWNITNFAAGKIEKNMLNKVFDDEAESNRRAWNYQEWLRMLNDFSIHVITASMTTVGIYLWYQGSASVGDIILIITLSINLAKIARTLSQRFVSISEMTADIRDALDLIGVEHEITDKAGAKKLEVSKGEIKLEDVSFTYPGTRIPVFENLSITIKPGQRVALVGESGSGKSTFAKLLLRLYDVQKGTLKIDQQNVVDVRQNSLRKNITVVPQDPELFHRSLKENIGYGKPNSTTKEIISAAKLAHAHEFILNLPKKYESLVGEKGVKLSGGQKQRIAIARAILKNAKILILDEATSALDSESESLIQDALKPLMKNKTVIAVAHRLSTISKFDRIVVFDKGQIVEDGSHSALLKKKGVYAKLWKMQVGGFKQ